MMRFAIAVTTAAFLISPMQSSKAASADAQATQPQTFQLSAAKKKAAKKNPPKVEYMRAAPAK